MAETVNEYMETDLGNVAPNPRGDYSETAEYEYLDQVAYAGGSYMCILAEGTVTGTAPTPGKTTEIWQEVSRPGNLTPEYVALHDDVVNKATTVGNQAAQVAQNAAQIEGMKENVATLQEQTAQDAQLTRGYRESAAGYASAAETSRTAAGESEENVRALVNGFDDHVEEQKTSAQDDITTSRQAAINAIAAQQVSSVNAVKQEGQKAINKTNADAEATAADRAAVSEMATTVDGQAAQVARNAAQVAEDKATAENYMQTAGESKKQALEAAERLKDSVNLVQKNTVDLQGKAPVIIGSATSYDGSPVEVNDSAEMQLQGLRLYGKSLQETTTGKNLSSIKSCQLSTNMVSSDIVPWTKKDRIYFSCDTENVDGSKIYVICRYYNESKIRVGANGTILLADGTRKEISFRGVGASSHGGDVDLTTIEYVNIEIGLSSASTAASSIDNIMVCDEENQTYEPYTGGKPSPSPEYPKEIASVGGNGSIEVNVRGKNLVDIYGYSANGIDNPEEKRVLNNVYGTTLNTTEKTDKLIVNQEILDGAVAGNYTSGYFCIEINRKLEVDKYYIITFRINVIRNPLSMSEVLVSFNGITFSRAKVIGDKVTVKAEYKELGKRQYVEVRNNGMSVELSDFMITEVGETDDYVPYTEQTVQFHHILNAIPVESGTSGITYTDADGQAWIADEIDFSRGKYVQRVWKGVFDGSSDEEWSEHWREGTYTTRIKWSDLVLPRKILCNQYIYGNGIGQFDSLLDNGQLHLYFNYDNGTIGIDAFKTLIASNPLVVMTYLDTPIETDLTQEQLQAYKSLTTFKQTSIISNDAGAQMEVEYACDTKTYIDNKLKEIAQALVASASEAE